MKSITHLFFDRRLRKYNACSSVPKCRTIVSINTFAKQNKWPWRKEGITRHLAMMNSRRGEPRALFITFYLINRTKSRRYREHHSSKDVHFEFHASKVHSYTYGVIFISLLLYSDLYCKKWLIFYGSSSCYNDNKIKMKEKKRKGKTYFRLARFDPERPSDARKDVTTRLRKLSRMYIVWKIFI